MNLSKLINMEEFDDKNNKGILKEITPPADI